MQYNKLIYIIAMALPALIASCKSTGHSAAVVLDEKPAVTVTANAGCRNSAIYPVENKESLETNLQSYSAEALKQLKFKTGRSEKRSTCKLKSVELTLSETCESGAVRLKEALVFESIPGGELHTFTHDTLLNNQQLRPGALSAPKNDYRPAIRPLTQRTMGKAKNFFYPGK